MMGLVVQGKTTLDTSTNTGSTGNITCSLSGAAQKGPYVKGFEVLIAKLLPNGRAASNVSLSEISDDLGSLNFTVEETGPILISADGVHIDEITGKLSQGRLNLKAIYNFTDTGQQKAYFNVLTHLSYKRIQT